MEIFEYILWGILCLVGGYILFRVISMAIFKSWIDAKTKERREDDGDNIKSE